MSCETEHAVDKKWEEEMQEGEHIMLPHLMAGAFLDFKDIEIITTKGTNNILAFSFTHISDDNIQTSSSHFW